MSANLFIFLYILLIYLNKSMAFSDDMQELIQTLHNTCVKESDVDEELIDKVNKEKVFEDNENLKCYMKCLMYSMSCMDDDGIIDEEGTIALLPDEIKPKLSSAIKTCGTKVGRNPCENAWLTNKCYAEMAPDVYMLI